MKLLQIYVAQNNLSIFLPFVWTLVVLSCYPIQNQTLDSHEKLVDPHYGKRLLQWQWQTENKVKRKKKVAVFQTPTCDIFIKAICWWRICRIWWVGESWLSLVGVHGHSEISRDTRCKRSRWREGMDTSTRYVALERTWTRHIRAKGNGKRWLPGERWLRCSHHHGSVFSLLGSHLRLRSGADTVRCAGIRDNLWKG